MIKSEIEKGLHYEILGQLNENLPNELDVLSTHSSVSDINSIELKVDDISHDYIFMSGTAYLDVNLRYGSDSDWRHDDGAEFPMEFEMGFNVKVDITDFQNKEFEYDEINTDKFYQ